MRSRAIVIEYSESGRRCLKTFSDREQALEFYVMATWTGKRPEVVVVVRWSWLSESSPPDPDHFHAG